MSKCVATPSCWLMIVWPGAVMWHNEHQVSRDVTRCHANTDQLTLTTHTQPHTFEDVGFYHNFPWSLSLLHFFLAGCSTNCILRPYSYLHISIVIKACVCVAPGSAVAALRWPGLRYFVTMDRSFVLFNKVNTNDYQFNTNLPHFQHKILSSFSSA